MAGRVEAMDDLGLRWLFDPQPLRADRHAAIAADFEGSAHAPNVVPPRATRCWPQGGALFFPGLLPRPLRGLAQFAMHFLGVAMRSQGVDVGIGDFDGCNLFAGEAGGQTALPELMFAFDFAFGLGRELHPMQTMQSSFSRSRIRFIRGAAGNLN